MIKDDLVFQWQVSESHSGYKIIASLLVVIIFTVIFAVVDVRLDRTRVPNLESATVLHFGNDDIGRVWRQRAEEGGPFPGRLEINGSAGLPGLYQGIDSDGISGWSGYEVPLRGFQTDVESLSEVFLQKGQRYFPERVVISVGDLTKLQVAAKAVRRPILTPFDSDALEWMPEELPEFDMEVEAGMLVSASWRFMLRLRPDGSVDQCVSLSGGADAGLLETGDWLRGLHFKPGDGERWLGLRVEFVNQ